MVVSGYGVVGDILTSSLESAQLAVARLGEGTAATSYAKLNPASVWVIAVPDSSISQCAQELANLSAPVVKGALVFHLSGVNSSALLSPLVEKGARVASLHMLRSCSDPETVAATFDGTYCGCEGPAKDDVAQLTRIIGGEPFFLSSDTKPLYHASCVCASNFIVGIIEVARNLALQSGLSSDESYRLLEPLVRGTVSAVFSLGTKRALTGPLTRGDEATIRTHLEVIQNSIPEMTEVYRVLTQVLLHLNPHEGIRRSLGKDT